MQLFQTYGERKWPKNCGSFASSLLACSIYSSFPEENPPKKQSIFRSLGHLILSASSARRLSGYVLPRAHKKTSMQRNGSCFSFVEFFALVGMEYD
jgi:hypothetical protein